MRKLTLICCMVGLILALPTRAWCASSPICELGSGTIDLMNGILFSPGKIPPVVLTETIAFAEECPADLVPAFGGFADNEQELHRAWLEGLKTEATNPENTALRELLRLTQMKLDHGRNAETTAYFDNVFSVLKRIPDGHQVQIDCLFKRLSLMALRQFPRTDGAGGFNQSDFLLFLLATHPVPFLKAVRGDQRDTSIWLSQLGAMSFAGVPSEREHRETIRKLLLGIVSNVSAPKLRPEKDQIENALRRIHFRAYK